MSRRAIQDEFASLSISRQRKYQLRMRRDGRCEKCGEPAVQASRCLTHLVQSREYARQKLGFRVRYFSASYRIEAQLKQTRMNSGQAEPV